MAGRARKGEVIDDRFRLDEQIGEGGFGVVYRATQISTGQTVAVKFLLTESVRKEEVWREVKRFNREMKLISRLKHPNIVRLIDAGTMGDKELFLVLDFIEGHTLHDVIRREGKLGVEEAVHLMSQVADALAYAHRQGIIHRDLKPQNIMLTPGGRCRNAMVLDFGIAGILVEARDKSYVSLTSKQEVRGTPQYISPEQLRQRPMTPQSDLYSWGLVFIEALSGRVAIQGDSNFEVALRHVDDDPIAIPAEITDPGLRAILSCAVAKDLGARYANAETMMADLDDWRRGERPSLDPPAPGRAPAGAAPLAAPAAGADDSGAARRTWIWLLALFALGILGIAVGLRLLSDEKTATPRPQTTEASAGPEGAPSCRRHSECPGETLCREGACVSWQSEDCHVVEGAVGVDQARFIGHIDNGTNGEVRQAMLVARLAVRGLNSAALTPPLVLISCDDGGDGQRSSRAAAHLVNHVGVDALVLPLASSRATLVARAVAEGPLRLAAPGPGLGVGGDTSLHYAGGDALDTLRAVAAFVQLQEQRQVAVVVPDGERGERLLAELLPALAGSQVQTQIERYGGKEEARRAMAQRVAAAGADLLLLLGEEESAEVLGFIEAAFAAGGPRYLTLDWAHTRALFDLMRQGDLLDRVQIVGREGGEGPAFAALAETVRADFGELALSKRSAAVYDATVRLGLGLILAVPAAGEEGWQQALARLGSGAEVIAAPMLLDDVAQRLQRGESLRVLGAAGPVLPPAREEAAAVAVRLWVLRRGLDGEAHALSQGRYAEGRWQLPYVDPREIADKVPLLRVETGEVELGLSERQQEWLRRVHRDLHHFARPGVAVLARETWQRPRLEVMSTEVTCGLWRWLASGQAPATACVGQVALCAEDGAPLTGVGALEAEAFCASLGMRLPTERDFEALARGLEGRNYAFAGELSESREEALRGQRGVASVAWNRTPEGIFDLAASVGEWVRCEPGLRQHCSGGFGIMGGASDDAPFWWQAAMMAPAPSGELGCARLPRVGFRCVRELP